MAQQACGFLVAVRGQHDLITENGQQVCFAITQLAAIQRLDADTI